MTSTRFKPYPETKDSGIEWLGPIPAHWKRLPLKRCLDAVSSGGTPDSSDDRYWTDEASGVPFVTIADMSHGKVVCNTARHLTGEGLESKSLSVLPRGTLLYSIYASLGKVALLGTNAAANQAILALVPNASALDQRFLMWWLRSMEEHLDLFSSSNTQSNLSAERVLDMPVFTAPLEEQEAIAEFLDRETAKINALVEKKEQLIELLQEKRTALISHAVTKGLDPDVPMKDSGIEWLGQIPAFWEIKQLRYLTPDSRPIMYGIVLPGPDVAEGVPIVKSGDIHARRLNLESLCRTTTEIESRYERSRLRGGDIVYSIRGSIGDCDLVPDELTAANLTQDAARVSPRRGVRSRWLLYMLRSRYVFGALEAGALGATIRGINIWDLKRVRIPFPEEAEQQAIANFLDRETAKLDALIAKIGEAIERLKEYRTALISAAVTGKIDVREAVQ